MNSLTAKSADPDLQHEETILWIGGYCMVYGVKAPGMEPFAVKMARPDLSHEGTEMARLLLGCEAGVLSRITSIGMRGVVGLTEATLDDDPMLMLEWVSGRNLLQLVQTGHPLPTNRAEPRTPPYTPPAIIS